jgi:hypothetical protein
MLSLQDLSLHALAAGFTLPAIAFIPALRRAAGALVVCLVRFQIAASAWVAALIDVLVPINTKNGRVSRPRLLMWSALNVGVVVAWMIASESARPGVIAMVGALNTIFALTSLFLLTGAFWALREGIDTMNGDKARRHQQFADLSTTRNAAVMLMTAIVAVPQVAASLHWMQDFYGLPLIMLRLSTGFRYLDFLAGVTGFSATAGYAPGWLGWSCEYALKTFVSAVVIGTAIGWFQQHFAFRKMIHGLLTKTDNSVLPLLKFRFVRAPSAIKSYVRAAFREETDDGRLVKLIQLAVDKHSYSFPASFLRRYPGLSERVRDQGSQILAQFVERKRNLFRNAFDRDTLLETVEAAQTTFLAGGMPTRADSQLAGLIVLPCLELLSDTDRNDDQAVAAAYQVVRRRSVQMILSALLHGEVDEAMRDRASTLLLKGRAQDALPEMLRCLQYMSDDVRLRVLQGMHGLIAYRGINFAFSKDNDPLGEMVRTIDWNLYQPSFRFTPAAIAALRQLRSAIVDRQRSPTQPRPSLAKPGLDPLAEAKVT